MKGNNNIKVKNYCYYYLFIIIIIIKEVSRDKLQ